MNQLDLLGGETPVEPSKLGRRQQLILDELRRIHPDPLTADEAGALIHAARGKHPDDVRCEFCSREGQDVLRRLAQLGHAVRRRGAAGYTLRDSPATERRDMGEIPW